MMDDKGNVVDLSIVKSDKADEEAESVRNRLKYSVTIIYADDSIQRLPEVYAVMPDSFFGIDIVGFITDPDDVAIMEDTDFTPVPSQFINMRHVISIQMTAVEETADT